MKKSIILVITVAIFSFCFLLIKNYVLSNHTSKFIGFNCAKISVNPESSLLAFGIPNGSEGEIVITDSDLTEITRIQTSYIPWSHEFSQDGDKLFVGLWDFESTSFQQNAYLTIYDTSDWSIDATIELPAYPVEFVSSGETLYVTCGTNGPVRLLKINVTQGLILDEKDFGVAPSGGFVLNNSGNKLYIDTNEAKEIYDEGGWEVLEVYKQLLVIDPETFSEIKSINYHQGELMHIINGPQDKILMAFKNSGNFNNNCIMILSTHSDEFVTNIAIGDSLGCRNLCYDDINNIVYACCLERIQYHDEELDLLTQKYQTLNKIAYINLDDYSSGWLDVLPECILSINLLPDNTRIFAGTADPESGMVYYIDLD